VIPVALKEWGENASDNPASLSRRLSILAASIRVAGRFPSFRVDLTLSRAAAGTGQMALQCCNTTRIGSNESDTGRW
jgi:hypothetical protein